MTRAKALWTGGAGALAVVTFVLSLLALIALNAGGAARMGSATLLRLAAGYDRRAEILLASAEPSPADRRQAASLSRSAIEQFPYDTSAWLRLAYVDALEHRGLTPAGGALLSRSYELVAVDPDVGLWRVRFALENSQMLSHNLRANVRNEAFALGMNGDKRSELRQMAATIRNPAGRLSAALWLNRLEAGVTK
ncbi:hypothetical protein DJ021_13660 [Phenylobacterium hankyongense]|uniref:Uncharacterized protein n=1 Tax=Phenylobacterium hankyongense TaxID=1813876 RepID=A0A328B1U1_9CAUL|nr:hypothetical protein [Phenylobacterium hankyongense]RAK60777.1 hypothetical protein DJ021_13660 [Phenylobacterium hankyongense]